MSYYTVRHNSTGDEGIVLRGRVVSGVAQALVMWKHSGLNEWVNLSELTQID